MRFTVIATGGEKDAACVRTAVRAAGVSDHIQVELVVDLRWLEPIEAGVDYYAMPTAPAETDLATDAFLDDYAQKQEEYARICSEGGATFRIRRSVGIPRKLVRRLARESDVLILPHPAIATAELRPAVLDTVADPPCPVLLTGAVAGRPRSATVCASRRGLSLEGRSRELLRRLVRGRVEKLRLPESFAQDEYAGWAPVVTADCPVTQECEPKAPSGSGELLAIVGKPQLRRGRLGRVRRWEPPEDNDTLLLPA